MKTNVKVLLSAFLLISSQSAFSQQKNDPVLLTIDKEAITVPEFQNIYKKNTVKDEVLDKKSLTEYLELFINFKLKVKEAEELGMDTTTAFKNELAGYRQQLAQPYLVDKEVNEKLIQEAYDRMSWDVRASHILVKVVPNALPKDTLAAYNKIMKIRARIMKGEDFTKVAKETSEDISAKENGGDLGYFTAFSMVYPFESAAYNTKAGEVSMPIRSKFGYHLVKVLDKRKAQGQILVAHIMVKAPVTKEGEKADTVEAKKKIDEIYAKLKGGEDFSELCKQYSDDKASAKKGGELPWFGTGRMVIEFEKAAFALKNKGDYSEPVRTQFGWHIIKKLDQKGIPAFDEVKGELKSKISKDSRAEKSKSSFVTKIEKEAGFKENVKAKDEIFKMVDTTLLRGKWKADRLMTMTKPLFNLGSKNYTQADFAKYLESRQTERKDVALGVVLNAQYQAFVNESVINFEEARLETKYPEFKSLMEEYRDGILLFELTDKKVWSKAVKDSAGIEVFYAANKTKYMWEQRADATIYSCADEKIAANVRKMLASAKKKKITNDDILKEINKDSQLNLSIETGKFQKGDNEIVDGIKWEVGTSPNKTIDKKVVFVVVNNVIAPEPKTLHEARGLVTADYQNYLESAWVESLRNKYKVVVDEKVLLTIQ